MKYLLQGGITLDFHCIVGGETEESGIENFLSLINLGDLKIKEITLIGADGKLHTVGIECSEMELDSVVEVDEDTPKKYLDYQIGSLAVSGNPK